MSLYVVKNDKGLLMDDLGQFKRDRNVCAFHSKSDAKDWADNKHAHVFELTDAPEKVVVSEAEDKVLKKAKNTTVWRPASVIAGYAYEHEQQGDDEALLEDRLMRAYVIGWTVEKPKRYVLPMDWTKLADGTIAYATLDHTGVWTIKGYAEKQSAVTFHATVTQSDIEAAPDWVKAITPMEVTDDAD